MKFKSNKVIKLIKKDILFQGDKYHKQPKVKNFFTVVLMKSRKYKRRK
ncbi:hypothetical protein CNEO4_510022 [Clostridium neonatale]|uniref:Uncharacterized protein n=1 Tax=Clostridium neonatale TaxID=137838 RepID=A0AA86JJV5_9CLOT|nr:hypothetical protein CNEO_44332 [Clostridium neonatale]CAG9713575.1 hypothetical protein CNEO_560044 [Clostridium neonatale]CAG9716158.1 hypothetical protein CNEO_380114 [Clostridium neonatale]CAI3207553.1 hypothetical protein CNEO2_490012 [Clostridium neonatale]CAI3208731.1 hypothetical protein CNEO2_60010 [Clostridium neonatale]